MHKNVFIIIKINISTYKTVHTSVTKKLTKKLHLVMEKKNLYSRERIRYGEVREEYKKVRFDDSRSLSCERAIFYWPRKGGKKEEEKREIR